MATLAIVALVTSFSVPALTGLIGGAGVTAATNALIADMRLARSEAVRRGTRVVICGSRDGANCSGSRDWEAGWLLFADDETRPGSLPAPARTDDLVRISRRDPDGLRLGASHPWVAYRADGTIETP
jgi:type IV fimbrial biogenesis protein FimT